MKIRSMCAQDYDGVYALWLRIKGFAIRSIDDSENNITRFLERNPGMSHVALEDGKVVGAILCGISGLGEVQQVFLNLDLKKSDSKIARWYQLALLTAVANSKIFVQKNNRPLQVELENGRSQLQNDFQIWKVR